MGSFILSGTISNFVGVSFVAAAIASDGDTLRFYKYTVTIVTGESLLLNHFQNKTMVNDRGT